MSSNSASTRQRIVLVIVCGVFLGSALSAQETKPNSQSPPVSSPLHTLLGIDPETGQFKPDQPRQPPQNPNPAQGDINQQLNNLGSIDLNNPDEVNKTIQNLLNTIQQNPSGAGGNPDDLAKLVGLSSKQIIQWHRIITFISGAVLLVYPFGRFCYAVIAFLFRRRGPELTVADRRYARNRFWQNIILSGLTAALIVVLTVAVAYVEWWMEPRIMIGLAVAAGVLGVSTVTVSLLMKNSTRELSYETMCEMRERQFALKKEIDDLRKQLKVAPRG